MGGTLYQRVRAFRKIKYGFCYGKTYREAKEKVTKYKAALVNGKAVPTNTAKHRFAYYCNERLRLKKENPRIHIHQI